MARSRSRSPSGLSGERRESPFPHRRHHDAERERRPKKSSGGLRWKEKRKPEEFDQRDEWRGLERGYRERARSPERERRWERSRSGERYRRDDRYSRDDQYDRRRREDDRIERD
ncbi:Peroxisome biosynthesis protein pex1, partial [Ascosphaera pollenicola]